LKISGRDELEVERTIYWVSKIGRKGLYYQLEAMHEEEEVTGIPSWNGQGIVIKMKCTRKRRFKEHSPGMGTVP